MIPTRPADCDRAGIPTIDCPPIPEITYTIPAFGQWNAEIEGIPPEFVPFLVVGAPITEITPPLPGGGTLQQEIGYAPVLNPIVGPPTPEDVPGSWAILAPLSETGYVGLLLPLIYVSQIAPPGSPFWLRARYVDEDGCETLAYFYVASGVEAEPSEVVVYALVNDELYELTILPPEEPDQPGPATDVIEVLATPTCPDSGRYVPVGPACGEAAVPVSGEVVVAGQVEVVNPVDEGGQVPLKINGDGPLASVPTSPVPRGLVATTYEIEIATTEPDETLAIPAGAVRIVLQGSGETDASVRFLSGGIEYRCDPVPTPAGFRPPVVIDAPVGYSLLGGDFNVQNLGSETVYATLTAYTPA